MENDWKEYTLTDLYSVSSGLSKPAKDFGEGYPFLSFKNVFYNYFLPDELTELVRSSDKERNVCSIHRGDVFLTRTSETMDELGMSSVARKDYPNATFNGFCKRLRPSTNISLYPEYVGYFLRSPWFRNELMAFSTMSTRASLNNDMIGRMKITLPPFPEQKAIAHILGSLDNKIELNRRMNATLEGMAQALFKSWFVDFDPVIDNAIVAGNPIPEEFFERAEARRKALADGSANREATKVFPATFQLTEEMGWIPEGWEVKELRTITTDLRRGISPKYTDENGVRVINQRCIRDHTINYSNARLNDTSKKKVDGRYLQTADLLINSTGVGTLGRMAQVLNIDSPTVTDSHVTVVRPDPALYMPYTFGRMMISIELQVESMGHGSTGQTELSRADLSVIPVIRPTSLIQEQSEILLSEWINKSEININQNGMLSKLRDTLLPKLISGELRISEVERIAEEALP